MEIRIEVIGPPTPYKIMKNLIRQSGCRISFYNKDQGIYYIIPSKPADLIKLGIQFRNNKISIK